MITINGEREEVDPPEGPSTVSVPRPQINNQRQRKRNHVSVHVHVRARPLCHIPEIIPVPVLPLFRLLWSLAAALTLHLWSVSVSGPGLFPSPFVFLWVCLLTFLKSSSPWSCSRIPVIDTVTHPLGRQYLQPAAGWLAGWFPAFAQGNLG